MAAIEFKSVGLSYGPHRALHDLSFEVPRGQFVALVGPTGCGKSSVLNLAVGLLKPSAGGVYSEDRLLVSINRNAAYMFQTDALLPWKTTIENIMFGPLLRGIAKDEAAKDAKSWLDRVGL